MDAYTQQAGSATFNMTTDTKISLNISISPQVSSNIGLYDMNTGAWGYPSGSLSSIGWYGTLSPTRSNTFAIAIKNNSSSSANYSGTFNL